MAISKKKNSPYYYTRFTLYGIRVQESTRETTRRCAQEYEERRRKEIKNQVLLGNKPSRSWAEAELRWLQEMQHKRSLIDDIQHFKKLGTALYSYALKDIDKDIIEAIAVDREKEGLKPASINRMLALIRAVLNKACKEWEWIEKPPTIRMRKENNTRIVWLTRKQANILLNELPPHLKAMAAFSLATGLRQANVKRLTWRRVDLAREHAMVFAEDSKNRKAISVPLNADAMKVLHSQKGLHREYVFTYNGQPVNQVNTKAWRNAVKRAGIKNFRWHDLRHTWASWHVQSGTSLQELFELGGWKSFDMVLRYAHLSSKHLKAAADRVSESAPALHQNKVEKGENR